MTGTGFSCRTKETLMDEAEESLQQTLDDELQDASVASHKLAKTIREVEWTDEEKLEWLGDVEEWVDAPDGIEWGIVLTSAGQMCDRWELMIPDRTPTPLHPNATFDGRWTPEECVDVLWLIKPEQYGELIDMWHTHHLQGTSLKEGESFETPQWVKDLAANSLTLKQAFTRWWFDCNFDKK